MKSGKSCLLLLPEINAEKLQLIQDINIRVLEKSNLDVQEHQGSPQ